MQTSFLLLNMLTYEGWLSQQSKAYDNNKDAPYLKTQITVLRKLNYFYTNYFQFARKKKNRRLLRLMYEIWMQIKIIILLCAIILQDVDNHGSP